MHLTGENYWFDPLAASWYSYITQPVPSGHIIYNKYIREKGLQAKQKYESVAYSY